MTCVQHPGSSVLVVGLTRESIKRIYIKDVLHVLNDKYRLGASFNRTELSMNFPNGSVLYLVGADSDESEMLKLLGQKFRLVIIDESSMYTNIDQRELVYAILKPAVADYRGTIAMIGTPSNYTNSLFYDITTGAEGGWSVHKWSALDNPHVRDNVQEDIDFLKTAQPGVEHTPRFKQHWLGEWYVDRDAMVYKFDPIKNTAPALPTDSIYHHVLGVDLGYEDSTAFVVGAYSYHDPKLYIVYTYKQKHMLLTDVAEKIQSLQERFNIHNIVVDGAGRQAVEEIKQRYALPLIATEKQHKRDFIELMNTDFQTAKICVLPGSEALIEEWENLIWDEKQRKAGNWIESATCENHAADAALYMWRWSYNYVSHPKPVVKTEEQKLDAWWDSEGKEIEKEKESDGWMTF
jgi:phage terminase large subunit